MFEWEVLLFVLFESNVSGIWRGECLILVRSLWYGDAGRFFYGALLFDGGCLQKVTGSKIEVIVVEVVV